MWRRAVIFVVLALALAVFYGSYRWEAATEALRLNLRAAARPLEPATVPLPEPVERYLQAVLPPGQPNILSAALTHEGTFNLSESGENWRPFTSHQLVVANPPGFDWDARIAMFPGINAFVHDAYVNEGILQVDALGLVPMASLHGMPELNVGELQRFLAEAVWYPTRLRSVEWQPIDAASASATIRHQSTVATVVFHFDSAGLVESVDAARYRIVKNSAMSSHWQCRLWGYERREGILVPIHGEVAWLMPGRKLPYWRGHLTSIQYEFERKPS